jgi:hypothetical protein
MNVCVCACAREQGELVAEHEAAMLKKAAEEAAANGTTGMLRVYANVCVCECMYIYVCVNVCIYMCVCVVVSNV